MESVEITVKEILQDLGSQLAYQESAGIEHYPASEGIRALLQSRPATADLPSGPPTEDTPGTIAVPGSPPEPAVTEPAKVGRTAQREAVAEIARDVAQCRACQLSSSRIMPVSGHGAERVRLLVVGDWLMVEKGIRVPDSCLFGIGQDRMLNRMFEAINLPPSDVFVTNLIKCAIPQGVQPQAEHVNACFSYLQKQVVLLRPEMILAMGMVPARVMLNRSGALARLRGRFHSFTATDGNKIPLVATYHPTFLLQNEGMKRATWEDLKLVARQLKLNV